MADISDVIAWDAQGFYDPLTGLTIDDSQAANLIAIEHSHGLLVDGIDNAAGGDVQVTSAEQNQQNLNAAAAQAAAQVGITGLSLEERSSWPQADRVQYLANFRAIILAHPDSFTPETVAIAQRMNLNRPAYGDDVTGDKPINVNAGMLWVTDVIADGFNALAPSLPGRALTAASSAADAMLNAANGLSAAAGVFGKIAPLVVPAAIVLFLWFGVKSAAKDPAGQAGKLITAGGKTVRGFLPY